jgi:5-methyltetrahydrofolate--homocysteine methyltransferase
MMASSNSITDYVPLENMWAMFDATFEFGRYPIDLKEGAVKGNIWNYKGKRKLKDREQPEELDVTGYISALLGEDENRVIELAEKDILDGHTVSDVVSNGLIPCMVRIGEQFQDGTVYIPEMMLSAKNMSAALLHFKKQLAGAGDNDRGKVVIGTVEGDLHDVGKNLVVMVLEGHGYAVEDLGISVSAEQFVQAVNTLKPDILAMSALLTTTMVEMRTTIDALNAAGVRDRVKVIVGGAPLTQDYADSIGADGYAFDAPGAALKCNELLSQRQTKEA